MWNQKARSRGWISILPVLFVTFAAYMYGSMGLALYAYSPTSNEQAKQQAPGEKDRSRDRGIAAHGGMTPAQPGNLTQGGDSIQLLPAQEPRLPGLHETAFHAACAQMYSRPLCELAFRTGGHAPP